MTGYRLPPGLNDLHKPRDQRLRVKRVAKNGLISIGIEHRGRPVVLEPHPSGTGIFIRFMLPTEEKTLWEELDPAWLTIGDDEFDDAAAERREYEEALAARKAAQRKAPTDK